MAAVMGLPHDDDAWLARLAELHHTRMELKQRTGQASVPQEIIDEAFEATREIHELLGPYVEERRSGESEDFIGMLWRDAEATFGEDWQDADIYSATMAMWEGGAGSTPPSTANGLYLLMTRPGLQDELRAGGAKAVKNFVEESLRLFGPVYFRPRIAQQDVELGGVTVKRGEQVLTLTVAGSRDESHYACPHAVDLERPAPRDHFSFFIGPRTCPGQGLARVELEEAAAVVLDRLHDLRLDPDAEPPRLTGLMTRRWEPLHALFAAT
jgi:cytochrome P450